MSSPSKIPALYLHKLMINNFRNISHVNLLFNECHNIFIGQNGHGKTNCLEAVAMAISLRSLQGLKNKHMIKHDATMAHINAELRGDFPMNLSIDIENQGKRVKLNDRNLKKSCELYSKKSLVSFVPAELLMMHGPAMLRRAVLDQATSALFFEHIETIKDYEKVVANRNKILKAWPLDPKLLNVFTLMLIEHGAKIIKNRHQAIMSLQQLFNSVLGQVLGKSMVANIIYQHRDKILDFKDLLEIKNQLIDWHEEVAQLELRRKITLFGAHLDDMVIELNGHNVKHLASRGQTRALVVSFKMA
jgi:DNA replication and repair protein RecF